MASSTDKPGPRRRFLFWLLLLLFGVGLYLGIPLALERGLAFWLRVDGADSARVLGIGLNPFSGRLVFGEAQIVKNGEVVGAHGGFKIDLGMRELFNRRLLVEDASLEGLRLDVERFAHGSLRLAHHLHDPTRTEGGRAGSVEGTTFTHAVRSLTLRDCRISYAAPELRGLLVLDLGRVEDLSLQGQTIGRLLLRGRFNDALFDLDFRDLAFGQAPALHGSVSLGNLRLDDFAVLLGGVLETFRGTASVQGGELSLAPGAGGGLEIGFKGGLALADGAVGDPAWGRVLAGALRWDGRAEVRIGGAAPVEVGAEGRLGGEALVVDLPIVPLRVAQARLDLDGSSGVKVGPAVEVDYDGHLDGAGSAVDLPGLLAVKGSALVFGGSVHYDNLGGQAVAVRGQLDAGPAAYIQERDGEEWMRTGLDSLAWDGGVKVACLDDVSRSDLVETKGLLTVRGAAYHLGTPLVEVAQGGLRLDGKTMVSFGGRVGTSFEGAADLEQTSLSLAALNASVEGSGWKGRAEYGFDASTRHSLRLDGKLEDSGIAVHAAHPAFHLRQAGASLEAAGLELGFGVEAVLKGALSLGGKGLVLEDGFGEHVATVDSLGIGAVQAASLGDIGLRDVEFGASRLSFRDIEALGLDVAGIRLDALEVRDLAGLEWDRVEVLAPRLTRQASGRLLFSGGSMTLENGAVHRDGGLTLASAALRAVYAMGPMGTPEAAAIFLADGQVEKIRFQPDTGLRIGRAGLGGLVLGLERDAQGIHLAGLSTDSGHGEQGKKSGSKAQRKIHALALNRLEVDEASRVHFRDATVSPPFVEELRIKHLLVSGFDSTRPADMVAVDLDGVIGKYASLAIKGRVAPLAEPLELEFDAHLRGHELPSLSPYTIPTIGYRMTSGQVSVDSITSVRAGVLDSKNEVVLKKMTMDVSSEKLAGQLTKNITMPLDVAFSLLRDRDDNVEVSIPLAGPLHDLDIGLGDLLSSVVARAVVVGAQGYLVYAFGPYGVALKAVEILGTEVMRVRLPAITFAPGEVEVGTEQEDFLGRLAKVLDDRPGLDVGLRGVAVKGEVKDADDAALLRLGNSRAENVRDALVSRHGIDPGRVLVLKSIVDSGENPTPRLDLRL